MPNPFKLLPSLRAVPTRDHSRHGRRSLAKGATTGGWVALAFVFVVLVVTVSPAFYVERISVRAGEVWTGRDLVTPFSFAVSDESSEEWRTGPVTVAAGTRVLSTGDRVTELQAAAVRALQSKVRQYNVLRSFGSVVFVAMAILFLLHYARTSGTRGPRLSLTASTVLMIAMPVVFALSVGRLGVSLGGGIAAAYAFPAGMIGMLATILFGASFAFLLVTLSCLLFGLGMDLNYSFFLVALIGGFTGAAGLATIKERKEVLITGLRLALVNVVTILAIGLIQHPERLDLVSAGGGVLNGLACYVLTLGFLPLFEVLFGVTTDVRLMELTSTHHPLLKMMEEEAPGSFQHSLNVSKLAESAAEAVNADYLLVRAGAYFHDIGKMRKPKYFSENQVTPEERKVHGRLSPYMSNLIIKNHVKHGIDLARQYRLPEKVVDFIPEHQGTCLIKFFYAQALQKAEPHGVVQEAEFRYPGPKPQTIEAAIVMLADSVEATATARFTGRTVKEDDIRKLVRDAQLEKFHDGQFDECDMTFQNLHEISESFVRTLLSRYHHRIEYPTVVKPEVRDIVQTERAAAAASSA
jgi:cyclic-di-AMP phosphodiesterase PgpH